MKRISVLEAMLPSAIKAKYKKAFQLSIQKFIFKTKALFNNDGYYLYKEAQQNNDLEEMLTLLNQGLIEEVTILLKTQKENSKAVGVVNTLNGDEVLAKLEKYTKQYDLYAFLLEESHRTVFLKEINDMGFSHSSLDSLIKKVILKNISPRFSEIHMQIVYLNKNKRGY